ncbi:hypothetical protein BaRGS_00019521 [Batillaria attramentaria]|uniref:Uncharacterized protein n=1 Tax=Batillaria attramentaria TaxID=370345 RepID=A0ABD0KQ45_9CAEN|nr:hypothetical protein BaRGS_006117 [Batillaria attramentaria]
MFSEPETDILEGATSVFADQVALEVSATMMSTPEGSHHMHTIYHLIQNNHVWLLQQLDIAPPLTPAGQNPGNTATDSKGAKFQLILTPLAEDTFNPAVEYNRIGNCAFDQEAIASFPFDWPAILTSDLGLSEAAFTNLLFNRHEMQSNAVLDDSEKRMVSVLRSAFDHRM